MATVKERLAAAARQSAPSLTPAPREAPPPKREADVLPDLREVMGNAADRLRMVQLTTQHVAYSEVEKEAKKNKAGIVTELKKILSKHQIGKCMVGDLRVTYFNAPRSKISRELLIQNNVPIKIIEASTTFSDAYTLRVSAPGEKEEE